MSRKRFRGLVQWRTGRDWSNEFLWGLGQDGEITNVDFSEPNAHFHDSIATIPELAGAIQRGDLQQAGAFYSQIADFETEAFAGLSRAAERIGYLTAGSDLRINESRISLLNKVWVSTHLRRIE